MAAIRKAILSVSDKTGLVEFASALAEAGVGLYSTGGTARVLREADLTVEDVSALTGFPEMLDGRVKTLHPKVHGGLLFLRDNPEHQATAKEHGIEAIDLICVNLYPFEQTVARSGVSEEEAIEQIDIGGPAMLRSAAKNMQSVTAVCDPDDYGRVIASMQANDGATTEALRRELAAKVFARVSTYDATIARFLCPQGAAISTTLSFAAAEPLRYGENPHQDAVLYRDPCSTEAGIAQIEQLHGKELSYNNYLDGDAALEAVKEFAGESAVVIIKHGNPCGVATASTLAAAFEAAWAGDPVSAFGSVIAVSATVDEATAACLKGRFVEALIAPDFTPEALALLQAKSKDLRILKLRHPLRLPVAGQVMRQIGGGMLSQDRDAGLLANWFTPTEMPFPDDKRLLAEFGIKVCKHIKSNAIALVRQTEAGGFALLGMGAGQPNRVDSLRKLALPRAHENIEALYKAQEIYGQSPQAYRETVLADCVMVSDAFFPFADSIEHAAEAGLRFVVQPGGSKRDEEVVSACDKYGIAMAFTGMRHFRH
jgi:phosphoribosylaminoimidazolecarboxamide formyltransferase/IMP cyclohydrolase